MKTLLVLVLALSGCGLYSDDDVAPGADAGVDGELEADASTSTECADVCAAGWYCDLEECRCQDEPNVCDEPCSVCTDLGYPGAICDETGCACDTSEPFGPHIECIQ